MCVGHIKEVVRLFLMFKKRYSKEELKVKIKQMEDVLGPLVKYNSDSWPQDITLRWCMEYLYILKEREYRKK